MEQKEGHNFIRALEKKHVNILHVTEDTEDCT